MPHSARWPPRSRQPVSSMLTARAARTRARMSSQGSVSASAVRARIASTVPVLMRDPNSCSQSSTTSNLLEIAPVVRDDREIVYEAASGGPEVVYALSLQLVDQLGA